jgi:hypothetical protein
MNIWKAAKKSWKGMRSAKQNRVEFAQVVRRESEANVKPLPQAQDARRNVRRPANGRWGCKGRWFT